MIIYVASSWRNEFQPHVVDVLRDDGHTVYDFKDADGFRWTDVDPDWKKWPENIPKYLNGLLHPTAQRGFDRDMKALQECECCIYVMPCGVSASIEAGWAKGAGKITIAYVPELREPELMLKIFDFVTQDLKYIRQTLIEIDNLKKLKRPKIGHRRGCMKINCSGCGNDWYSEDYSGTD